MDEAEAFAWGMILQRCNDENRPWDKKRGIRLMIRGWTKNGHTEKELRDLLRAADKIMLELF